MKVLLFFLLIFSISGCATSQVRSKRITLQDVEQFNIGKDHASRLVEKLGRPDEIKDLPRVSPDHEFWFYRSDEIIKGGPKTSFTVSKVDGVIQGSAWIPYSTDECATEKEVFSHFKNVKFKATRVKQNPHWYVNDLDYTNEEKGISFRVIKPSNVVEGISFGVPHEARIPAGAPKQSL